MLDGNTKWIKSIPTSKPGNLECMPQHPSHYCHIFLRLYYFLNKAKDEFVRNNICVFENCASCCRIYNGFPTAPSGSSSSAPCYSADFFYCFLKEVFHVVRLHHFVQLDNLQFTVSSHVL